MFFIVCYPSPTSCVGSLSPIWVLVSFVCVCFFLVSHSSSILLLFLLLFPGTFLLFLFLGPVRPSVLLLLLLPLIHYIYNGRILQFKLAFPPPLPLFLFFFLLPLSFFFCLSVFLHLFVFSRSIPAFCSVYETMPVCGWEIRERGRKRGNGIHWCSLSFIHSLQWCVFPVFVVDLYFVYLVVVLSLLRFCVSVFFFSMVSSNFVPVCRGHVCLCCWNLIPGCSFMFRVQAINEVGIGPLSAPTTLTTQPAGLRTLLKQSESNKSEQKETQELSGKESQKRKQRYANRAWLVRGPGRGSRNHETE